MRLVLVVGSLGGGGAERQASILYSSLKDRNDVCLISLSGDDTAYADGLQGVTYLDHRGPHSYPSTVMRLRALLRSDDCAVCFNWRNNTLVEIARPEVKRIVRYGGLPRVDVGAGVRRIAAAQSHRTAAAMVATCAGLVNSYLDYLGNLAGPYTWIHNAIEPDLPSAEGERAGDPYVVAAGRLIEEKDHASLLRGYAAATQMGLRHQLVIAGDGPMRAPLQSLANELGIADRVMFLGFTRDMYEWLRGADLMVMTSLSEGFGNVMIESLALGTPVLSTDAPFGPREILHAIPHGRLVPVGDVSAIAEGMLQLTRSSATSTMSRELASAMTRKAFSAQAMADRYLELARSL